MQSVPLLNGVHPLRPGTPRRRRWAEASKGRGGALPGQRPGAPVAVVDIATDLLAGGGGPVLTGLCGHILTEGLVGPVATPAHLHPAAP